MSVTLIKSTDTIAVDSLNNPFRIKGELVFGMMVLIENLNNLNADIVF
jgi:hypothetical protein